jgi:hypothetical protein
MSLYRPCTNLGWSHDPAFTLCIYVAPLDEGWAASSNRADAAGSPLPRVRGSFRTSCASQPPLRPAGALPTNDPAHHRVCPAAHPSDPQKEGERRNTYDESCDAPGDARKDRAFGEAGREPSRRGGSEQDRQDRQADPREGDVDIPADLLNPAADSVDGVQDLADVDCEVSRRRAAFRARFAIRGPGRFVDRLPALSAGRRLRYVGHADTIRGCRKAVGRVRCRIGLGRGEPGGTRQRRALGRRPALECS